MVFDGHYGSPQHRRQRYRCVPPDGSPWHRFTPALPRQRPHSHECLYCERGIGTHEGPPTGRRFHFTTMEVAHALSEVGKGRSYREVAIETRLNAARHIALDGVMVGDWVELFAPGLAARFAPTEWPASIAVDRQPFKIGLIGPHGGPVQGGQPAFDVFAATERVFEHGRQHRVVLLRTYPGKNTWQQTGDWADFFRQLDGMPERIVCDDQRDIVQAIKRVWPPAKGPSPLVWYCRYHLKARLLDRLREDGVPFTDPLYEKAEQAITQPWNWQAFLAEYARHVRLRKTERWLKSWQQTVEFQLQHQRGLTVASGGVETTLQVVKSAFSRRHGSFRNRKRTNRLLSLMQLQANRQANLQTYSKVIRETLEANGGHAGRRRLICDTGGGARSLRP
jgi:hypothetical protein